jgi:hypothetical protein
MVATSRLVTTPDCVSARLLANEASMTPGAWLRSVPEVVKNVASRPRIRTLVVELYFSAAMNEPPNAIKPPRRAITGIRQ